MSKPVNNWKNLTDEEKRRLNNEQNIKSYYNTREQRLKRRRDRYKNDPELRMKKRIKDREYGRRHREKLRKEMYGEMTDEEIKEIKELQRIARYEEALDVKKDREKRKKMKKNLLWHKRINKVDDSFLPTGNNQPIWSEGA